MEREMTERQLSRKTSLNKLSCLFYIQSHLSEKSTFPCFPSDPILPLILFSENVIQISPYIKVLSPLSVPEGGYYVDFLKLTISIVNQDEHIPK